MSGVPIQFWRSIHLIYHLPLCCIRSNPSPALWHGCPTVRASNETAATEDVHRRVLTQLKAHCSKHATLPMFAVPVESLPWRAAQTARHWRHLYVQYCPIGCLGQRATATAESWVCYTLRQGHPKLLLSPCQRTRCLHCSLCRRGAPWSGSGQAA